MNARQKWSKHVAAWRASGLTRKAYSAKVGINAWTLSHYSWKLRQEADETPAPTFVELALWAPAIVEVIVGEVTVRVSAGTDRGTLRDDLAVLREEP